MSVREFLPARVKRQLRHLIGGNEAWYRIYGSLNPNMRDLMVTPDTDFVIEGYPRSANSFAVIAFQLSQTSNVKIAHHLHYPMSVELAAKWAIPCLVLIRDPVDAVSSLMVREGGELNADEAMRFYVWFYAQLQSCRDWIFVAPFSVVIEDFGAVIAKLNSFYGTSFDECVHDDAFVRRVYDRIEKIKAEAGRHNWQVAYPNEAKSKRKAGTKQRILNLKDQTLRNRAYELYHEFIYGIRNGYSSD